MRIQIGSTLIELTTLSNTHTLRLYEHGIENPNRTFITTDPINAKDHLVNMSTVVIEEMMKPKTAFQQTLKACPRKFFHYIKRLK